MHEFPGRQPAPGTGEPTEIASRSIGHSIARKPERSSNTSTTPSGQRPSGGGGRKRADRQCHCRSGLDPVWQPPGPSCSRRVAGWLAASARPLLDFGAFFAYRGLLSLWGGSLLRGASSPLAGALGLPAPPWPSCQPSASRLRLGLRGVADSLDTLPDAL